MRCLELLGLADRVSAQSERAVGVPFRHYRSGVLLRAGFDADSRSSTAHEARQIHRADLHALLVQALRERAPDALILDRRLEGVESDGTRVRARFADGSSAEAELLVGCDGVRSVARAYVCPDQPLRFTGQVAFRCLVPVTDPADIPGSKGSIFLGPGRIFNRYPLRRGSVWNCAGVAKTDRWEAEGWNTPATRAEFLAEFADWHPEVTGLIARAPAEGIIKWGLFSHEPLPEWSRGPITLLGDAAHPMLPFLGLGAALAMEDACILARALALYPEVGRALAAYEATRKPRATLVHAASNVQADLLQSSDPDRYGQTASPAHDRSLFEFDPLAVPL
jgi:salicylate hydroxylase